MTPLKNNPEVKTLLQQAERKAYIKGLKAASALFKEVAKSAALSSAGDKITVKAIKAVSATAVAQVTSAAAAAAASAPTAV